MKPTVASRLNATSEAWEVCEKGMRMAVTEPNGTANKVFGEYPVAVCAKTGTAQHGPDSSDNASFVCYAPADDPQIAIAIYVEKGAQGGALGNIAKEIFNTYFVNAGGNDTVAPENAMN